MPGEGWEGGRSGRSRGRTPWGLVGMLPLVWAVEGFIARHPDVFPPPRVAGSWVAAASAAGAEAVGRDVLYFGDSQVAVGVLPREVEHRAGLPGYNLAVLRGMPASSYALLKRALDAGARPRAVVVDFNPGLLASRARFNSALWRRVLGAGDALALIGRSRDPALGFSMTLGWLFPSSEVRAGRRQAAWGLVDRASRERNRGAVPVPVNLAWSDGGSALSGPGAAGSGSSWRCHRENAAYVDAFLRLAESHGARVFWLIPPLSPALQARRFGNGREGDYSRFVDAVRRDHPALTVLDGRRLGLGHADFVDTVHLSALGAHTLSDAVGGALASVLSGAGGRAGWVRLDPAPGRDPGGPDAPAVATGRPTTVR